MNLQEKKLKGALEDTVDFLKRCDYPQDLDRLKKNSRSWDSWMDGETRRGAVPARDQGNQHR